MDFELFIAFLFIIIIVVFTLITKFKFFLVVETGTEVVMERLGKFHKVLPPGIHFTIPILYSPKYVRWSRVEETRIGQNTHLNKKIYNLYTIPVTEQVHDLPDFRSSTKDRIDVFVNGLMFFKIVDVRKAVYNINDLYSAIENLVETAIRDYTSTATLEEVFVSRDKIMARVVQSLNDCEENWGIRVSRFEIQEINCSDQVRKATETAVLKKREAEARLAMAESTKQAKLLEMEASNEVNYSRAIAEEELKLKQAETERKLNTIKNQILLETTETELKMKRMEQEEQAKIKELHYQAEANGLRTLLAVNGITENYIRHRNQLKAWSEMSSNPNNKIVLPYNSVPLLGAQSLLASLANTDGIHDEE